MKTYLFDTNIFIRSKNEMPADLWPSFWKTITELIEEKLICSSIKVKDEIEQGKDELTTWMRENTTPDFYIPIDAEIILKYQETQNWANSNEVYKENAKIEYAEVADAYLVATAAAKNMILVTFETSDPTCRKRVKIPDACIALGVEYCDLNTVLRTLGKKI